ncbi:hypothetical protein M378DRAFT_157893 [Amanita muscaria Koide BX008]|uniref:Uncharacterized protein n=1 Tax=Amanita muscaria (strain Koide BX008) TaxID=946122 RepID=A0A0C2XIG2_AMAMK|nr:hypothetical protein M378DRAFT_157893 [Amanita muscaria Koide BX008]
MPREETSVPPNPRAMILDTLRATALYACQITAKLYLISACAFTSPEATHWDPHYS